MNIKQLLPSFRRKPESSAAPPIAYRLKLETGFRRYDGIRFAAFAVLFLFASPAFASGGGSGIDPFIFRLAIFVLAIFVGYFVVWSVTPALHTPLMSVTNAISSVIVVGALLAVGVSLAGDADGPLWSRSLGFVALVFASINIFGGFLVTQRMLAMYQKKK